MRGAMVKDNNDQRAEWTRELDLSRCKRRIDELVGQIEELQAKLGHQEHYYQMNVARIEELEAALREITSKFSEHSTAGAIARRALEGKHE